MLLPPDLSDPYRGTFNPAIPVPNGSLAASFVAFGWFKDFFNNAIPQFAGDMGYVASLGGSTYV